ncbi:MAG: methyltransferase [Actinobacteria bacterium 69-20]|jgi:methylase of polypeptide subunit release factors|nr:methyltransferase [Actinomycetota bacterium]OJV25785.1 MAG: methyltransferase [Actinobacteria bacterium 69-20]
MSTPAHPLTDPAAVDRLAADLAACGYDADHVPALLGVDAHNALGRGQRWPALYVTGRAAADGSALSTVTRLFLFGTSEPADAVAAALPSLGISGGIACGALEVADARDGRGARGTDSDDRVGSNGDDGASRPGAALIRAAVDIRPHADEERSYLVVSDFDSDSRPGPVRRDHVLGIGAASVTLARAVIRRPVDRVLDLGTGCGIQALHCDAHAGSVTATDTNPRALALAGATARLNSQQWDLRAGSLFEPVAGERFDLIVSNPPFVISSGTQRFEYRDSGLAGDELCRRLVLGIPDHLTPGGTAQILANWLIRGDGDWRLGVGSWVAATGLDGWVVQREVAPPAQYVALWLQDTGEAFEDDAADLAGEWLDYFARENVTGIGMGSITLRRPEHSRAGTPDVIFDQLTGAGDVLTGPEVDAFLARRAYLAGVSDADLLDVRLSLADTDILEQRLLPGRDGWTTVLRMLHRPSGPGASVQLDEWGQALFAGCRGDVTLRTLVELMAAAHELDPTALAAAILPTIRTAITRGLLHPVDGIG